MVSFACRRIAAGAVLVVVISFLTFALIAFAQPNAGRELLGVSATQHAVDLKNHELGLDRPMLVRYLAWLRAALHGDLGDSWFTDQSVAGVSQQVRGSVLEVLRQDYVRTLRARGLPTRVIVLRHVLRNASGPALSVLGLQFVSLLGGAAIVEQIFALPGVGSMTVQYTGRGDVPMIMGLVMVSVVGIVLANLLIDMLNGWLTPKVRMS